VAGRPEPVSHPTDRSCDDSHAFQNHYECSSMDGCTSSSQVAKPATEKERSTSRVSRAFSTRILFNRRQCKRHNPRDCHGQGYRKRDWTRHRDCTGEYHGRHITTSQYCHPRTEFAARTKRFETPEAFAACPNVTRISVTYRLSSQTFTSSDSQIDRLQP
jgi:hypothetical protein